MYESENEKAIQTIERALSRPGGGSVVDLVVIHDDACRRPDGEECTCEPELVAKEYR